MDSRIPLCRLRDIPDGGAKGIEVGRGASALDIILLRRGAQVFAYTNRCPHKGTPLETFPNKFLDQSGELLICSTHGARFRVSDGVCVEGPCEGASLERRRVHVSDEHVTLASAESAKNPDLGVSKPLRRKSCDERGA